MNKLLLAALISGAMAVPAFAADYTIMAPASPGGGWDQTARSMQETLQAEGISSNVQVTGEADVIVVPAASELQTVDDLVAKLKADPGSVAWAGGSAGGVDHIAAGLFAKTVGVDPTTVNYIAYSGGGEALAAVLGGQVTVGISGLGEFDAQIKAGDLRALATTGSARLEGSEIPTLTEAGVDLVVENWRMVAAAPGITDEQKAAINADIEKMAKSATWQQILETKGWQDMYLAGADFDAQLAADIEATSAILKDIGLVQ